MMKATTWIVIALIITVLMPSRLVAATAAYWRHEEGADGGVVAQGSDTVLDETGANHMRTFGPGTAATYTTTVSPLALRSGALNNLALDFGPGGDNAGLDDDNYTEGKPIHTQLFTAMTVELAFTMQSVGPGQYQAVFGKDGKPLGDGVGEDDSPVPPLKVMVRGDDFPNAVPNQIFVEWIDGDGTLLSDIHILSSGFTAVPGEWYHVAFTLSPTNAELWIAEENGPYTLVDSASGDYVDEGSGSVQVFEPLGYTIGRGMFNNGVTDWADAIIDEVRVSDTVLTPDQFLFLTNDAPADDADFDNDGDVDGNDFLVWQRGIGGAGSNMTGDADGDGAVDGDDLAIWRDQFGTPEVLAIPEPAGGLALVSAAIGLAALRRRR
jgi:hypothetical protein